MREYLLMFLMTAGAMAQTTTYTGVIKDLAGNVVTSGQVTYTLTPPTDSTIPGIGRFTPVSISCNINTDGTLSGIPSGACKVASNTTLSPTGTAYRICIQAYFATPGSCFYDYAITASKDITTVVPTLATGPINYGGVPGPPLDFVGTWDSSKTYISGQTAVYSNVVYISLANPNLNNTPSSSPSFWSPILAPGNLLSAPSGSQSVSQPAGTTLGVNSLNGVLEATLFSGSDIGAKINAAYAALPAKGGLITVNVPVGGFTYTTPIIFGTAGKPATIDCRANNNNDGLFFSAGSGTALTFNVGTVGTTHPRGYGTRNCFFLVSGTSTVLFLGGANGAEGFEDHGSAFYATGGSSTGVVFGDNTWDVLFDHSTIASNFSKLLNIPPGLANSGEQINFNGVFFEGGGVNSILLNGGGLQFNCNDCSIDDSQVVASGAAVVLKSPHFENPGGAISWPFIRSIGNTYISSPSFSNDHAGTTASSMISVEASSQLTVDGMNTVSAGYTYPSIYSIAGAASLYSIAPVVTLGSTSYISGTTTGRYFIDTGNTCGAGLTPCKTFLSNAPVLFNAPALETSVDAFGRTGALLVDNGANPLLSTSGTGNNVDYYHMKVRLLPQFGGDGCMGTGSSGIGFFTENKTGGSSDTSAQVATLGCTGNLRVNGHFFDASGVALPNVGTPTVGKAACIKAAGPPVVIGYCSTVVDAGGACTCN
jgi:hypothetical protein